MRAAAAAAAAAEEEEEEEEEAETPSFVSKALHLITSVISSSYSIRSFPAKWRSIRENLERLHSDLSAAAVSANRRSPELSELLQAIASTAEETHRIALRCADESYGGGRLLLQSDLDAASAKLGAHIKHLAEAYSQGALAHCTAIVVPKPGPGASREDARFYTRDLLSRARVGDFEMKIEALKSLNGVLSEDDRYVKILATEEDHGGVGFLVSLLENGHAGVRENALEAICIVSGFDSYRGEVVIAGAIAPVIQILETGSGLAKEAAARALKKLTENSDNAWSVCAHGGVTALLKVCGDVNSGSELVCSACSVLKSLSAVEEIKRFMLEDGAIPIFVNLLNSTQEVIQIQAIEFLAAIFSSEHLVERRMSKEEVVELLLRFLDPNSPHSSKSREVALRAIEALSFSSTSSTNRLIASGFLNQVLFFIKNGEISIQQSALKASCRLCGLSAEAKKAMGDAGFMPELVRMIDVSSSHVREMAAEALCSIISVQRNRRRFIQDEHNVSRILQLLKPEEEKSVTKKFLLSVLMYITDSNSGRRKIMSSDYVKHLEKLAEFNVSDAKKIVKKLAGGRIRSMFNGIWS
ncbi:U-box domain-containing protein 4 [Ananas comosus]|uniref:U-box domain-containing protein 4 n=1 Tax=Ananas comosus TaxID=4615 RepID=A0A199UYQ3_ANACO|nr:U-box domain-containing protein 4 [Ananas comosus]